MKLSQRALSIQASPIRKLTPFANKAKEQGKKVYHLNIGQPDISTPPIMLEAYKNFHEEVLAYGPSEGLESYRKNLVNYYKRNEIEVTAENILVTTGGSEAILFVLCAICDYGDEIIIPEPFYTNYNGFATIAGVKIVPLTTYAKDGFALPDSHNIEACISPRTKAVMLCNPGNPTGTVYNRKELERVAKLAIKHGIYIIVDEVYREFIYDGISHTSILQMEGIEERAIMVDSISKRFSACGARIGAVVSRNDEVIKAIIKFAQARLCPPTIDQIAANACISLSDDYFYALRKEYEKRRNIVFEELQEIEGVLCIRPEGAFYVFAHLPIPNTEDFVKWMLTDFNIDNETVMCAPGEGFYSTPNLGKNELRIAYVLNERDLKKAMYIFRKGLEEYRARINL
jgi:aspartate aminotransferase